jgi:hypothetical protein
MNTWTLSTIVVAIRFPAHRRYLMFLRYSVEWNAFGPTYIPLLIENDRLVSLTVRDKLHGMSLNEIVKEARKLAKP